MNSKAVCCFEQRNAKWDSQALNLEAGETNILCSDSYSIPHTDCVQEMISKPEWFSVSSEITIKKVPDNPLKGQTVHRVGMTVKKTLLQALTNWI